MVDPIPQGYHSVIPYLIVDDAEGAIDYYTKVFGGEEVMRFPMEDRIAHAEIKIGDAHIMLADEAPDMGYRSPEALGGTPVSIMLYVPDVDAVFAAAIEEGATEERAVQDQFYGDRSGTLVDPYGHRWTIATHVEDVSAEEMQRRMSADAPEEAEADADA